MLQALTAHIKDILYPPCCLSCLGAVADHGTLCAPCWDQLRFVLPPHCHGCGLPFAYSLGKVVHCAPCLAKPPPYRHARALLRYNRIASALVHRFKYQDNPHLAPFFARWLTQHYGDYIRSHDLLIPVPLHRYRLWKRRYNQATLLAFALSRMHGIPLNHTVLRRTRATPQQVSLPYQKRIKNVKGAFALAPDALAALQGKRLLLIDDVMTTGATLRECTRLLKKGKAAEVNILTLARTVLDEG